MNASYVEGCQHAALCLQVLADSSVYDDESVLMVAHELVHAGHTLYCKANMWLAVSYQDKEEAAAVAGYRPSVLLY